MAVDSGPESSAGRTGSSWRRVRVGAVVATDSNILLDRQPAQAEKGEIFSSGEAKVIGIALRAVQLLAARGL